MSNPEQVWLSIAERTPGAIETVFRCEQATEILTRTRRVAERLFPRRPVPSAFYDPAGFVARAIERDRERAVERSIQKRIKAKVEARDRDLSIVDKARRIAAGKGKKA